MAFDHDWIVSEQGLDVRKLVTYLIYMGAHNKDGSLGCLYCDRTEPEVKTCVLIPQSYIPQQQIHSSVGHEILERRQNENILLRNIKVC